MIKGFCKPCSVLFSHPAKKVLRWCICCSWHPTLASQTTVLCKFGMQCKDSNSSRLRKTILSIFGVFFQNRFSVARTTGKFFRLGTSPTNSTSSPTINNHHHLHHRSYYHQQHTCLNTVTVDFSLFDQNASVKPGSYTNQQCVMVVLDGAREHRNLYTTKKSY